MTRLPSPDAFIETLEPRRLMSVFVRAHVLHIVGTPGDDTVKFFRDNSNQLRFSLNGKFFRVSRQKIQSMEIDAGAGDDSIIVANHNGFEEGVGGFQCTSDPCPQDGVTLKIISIAGTVRGGPGNDTIVGGIGRWSLIGGDGDDVIKAWPISTSVIRGGAGNDTLTGGSLNDHLSGGTGNDLLIGRDGDDTLDGGDGFDLVKGGKGHNTINPGPQPPLQVMPLLEALR